MIDDNRTVISGDDKGPYYSVFGDEKTWVSNGTVDWNKFDAQKPSNYSDEGPKECLDGQGFLW